MNRFRNSIPLLLLLVTFLASAPVVLADFYDPPVNDANMSILVEEGTLDGESLVPDDEIGCFTPDGVLAGATKITDDGFPIGIAAWGDDRDVQGFNGFVDGEEYSFKVWDHQAEEEWDAEREVTFGEGVYHRDDFNVCNIAANREAIPRIRVAENAHDFGAVRVGRVGVWQFAIESVGNSPLTVASIQSTNEAFTTDFQNAVDIAAGENLAVEVTFTPDAAGDFAGDLTIRSNATGQSEVAIHLTATGEQPLAPNIALSANERRFGRVMVGQSRNMTVFISNEGDLPLEISDMTTGDEAFSYDFDPHIEIAGGARYEAVITFNPSEGRAYETNLAITSNDPDNEVVNLPLYGEGMAEGQAAVAVITASEHFYGAVVAGQSASWRMVVINEGGSDLLVTGAQSSDDAFSVEFGNDAIRLRSGDFLHINTSFNPGGAAFYEGSLTVFSNDEENGELSIPVSGVGVAANAVHFQTYNTGINHTILITASLFEGAQMAEGGEVAVFTESGLCAGAGVVARDGQVGIAAYGDDESTDIIDGFTADEPFSFKVWDVNTRVEAWGAPEYTEGPEGYSSDALTILSLSANVGDPLPDISLSETDHFYGQVPVGEGEDWILTVTNQGRGALNVLGIDPDLNSFTTDFDGQFELALGESRDITVTFSPEEQDVEYNGRLTITSDDPVDSVLYVDMNGFGVDVRREPEIHLAEPNHFFGTLLINTQGTYTLRIQNIGGGLMRLENIAIEGSNTFTTNWPGNPRNVPANEFFDLTVNFRSAQAGSFEANIVITSDDPNNGVIRFHAEGDAVNEASHFHHRVTDGNHSILIDHAIIHMPGDREAPLVPGSEIAIFTTNGLCAGHTVIEEQGEVIGLAAWGDDRGTEVVDGFTNGEAFTFLVWDRATRQELAGEPTYLDGPQNYQTQAVTELDISCNSEVDIAQIGVDPAIFQFGAVRLNTNASHVFHIQNVGGVDLTVSRIASNMNVFTHDFNNQATVLHAGESIDVTVTFRPTSVAPYEGVLTVFNDAPGQEQFTFRPNGMGSDERGHFDYMVSDRNHSILVEEFLMGGAPASIGDQVGVFTEAGLCAGVGTVEDPGVCGIAAWHDDPDTRFCVEGFAQDETMTLKVWDFSQNHEYDNIEPEVVQGDLIWTADGFTVVNISIEGVVAVIPNPPAVNLREGEVVNIHFTVANPPDVMRFTFNDRDTIAQNAGNVTFTDNNDNTADFRWETNFNAFRNRPYALRFQATYGNITDIVTVMVTLSNVNQRPIVANPFQNDVVTFDEDPQMRDNPPRFTVVENLNVMFNDPDGNPMLFRPVSVNPNMFNRTVLFGGVQVFELGPPPNFFGDVAVVIRADDQQGGMPGRDLRGVDGASIIDADASDPAGVPVRDLFVDYAFTVHFNSVNDLPGITEPTRNDAFVWNIDERQNADLVFNGTDIESQGQAIVWTMPDRGGLPDAAQFTDNRDGTAHLAWQPVAADIGQYNTVVRMTDADGGQDNLALTINVRNINDPPVYLDDNQQLAEPHPIPDANLQEDAARTVIATLNDNHWIDPDQGDQLNFGVVAPLPADLQVQYNVQTTEVSVQPRVNTFGEYDVIVYCRDRAQAPNEVRHTIHVTVASVNDRPTFIMPLIPNLGVNPLIVEDVDPNRRDIIRLSLKFRDVDVGDALVFTVRGAEELGLVVNAQTSTLSRQFAPNYNTYDLENRRMSSDTVVVIATDRAGDFDTSFFTITITPDVNDLPDARAGGGGAFRLLTPENNHNFENADSLGPFNFSWEQAIQNPWEIDSVRYYFRAWIPGIDDTLKFDTLSMTSYTPPYDSLFGGILRDRDITVNWKVIAVDRGMLVPQQNQRNVPAANNNFAFTAKALEITEIPHAEMPQDYFISNSYPNPFNNRTTLRIGLPTPGDVQVSVWDMHGRMVAELAAGYHQAGQYELNWMAEGMTSGIYLIKMQSGSFVGMQKAILVR